MVETNFPTEQISLPSKGKLYPENSPLRSGVIEIKYPSSKSEDILTNQEYIQKGTVIDKFLQDLIVDKTIDYNQLLIGDKNAILVAARILGYGKSYVFEYNGIEEEVDLSNIQDKPLHSVIEQAVENRFTYQLPIRKNIIEFKLLTHNDEQLIDRELKSLKKISKNGVPELSTRLKYMVVSVDGSEEPKDIRNFVETQLLAADSRAFRKYVAEIQPDIDMVFYPEESSKAVQIPILPNFLWPDISI